MKERANRLCLAMVIVVLALLHFDYPRFPSPNERSRLYLLESLLERGTFAIGESIAVHGDMEDKVVFAGITYSNKPPGLVALALPAMAILEIGADFLGVDPGQGTRLWIARSSSVTLPVVLWLLLFARELSRRDQWSAAERAGLVAGAALGTGFLPYAALFMSHATAAALIGSAALVLTKDGPSLSPGNAWLAGLLCGVAGACEYPAAIPGAILLLGYGIRSRSPSAILAIAAGLAPSLALVAGYNLIVFGNPLDLGYGHHVEPSFARIHGQGLLGFGWPTLAGLYGLLLSASRGLLVWSPLLLLAVPGVMAAWRRRDARFDATLRLGAAGALILFIAGYPNWHGGWAIGPRYLLPAAPLLVLCASRVEGPWRAWLPGLGATGIALHAAASLTWPFLPDLLANPLRDLTLPLALNGCAAPVAFGGAPILALVAVAIAGTIVIALRPRPVHGLLLVVALTAWLGLRARSRPGPIAFLQAEVFFRIGRDDLAMPRFRDALNDNGASPALREHARMRLATPPAPTP